MPEIPERVWLESDVNGNWNVAIPMYGEAEFIRADYVQAQVAAAELRCWDAALSTLHQMKNDYQSILRYEAGVDVCAAAIVALENKRNEQEIQNGRTGTGSHNN
jgi:hypothetical protein